ncbi:RAMP superfamily CRISPR-associated protein [Zoogloea sp.]|uniref:RAMP superfamily CRISPR-associated protein n=1 Tax=Zoogloea sp. TaxID=49181 RepID=UPI0035B1B99F
MKTAHYTILFHTPAFLGNAEQSGQWRTPPFKAQLRQWWRVAYAASRQFRVNTEEMRQAEGLLFGNAWLEDSFSKSLVRIRLGEWRPGKLKSWDGLEQGKIDHPEAEKSGRKVGPHAYLGYGPLDGRGGTKFSEKVNAAIQAGKDNTFSIAYPDQHAGLIEHALVLMSLYGTVGGRSRNGWGSYGLLGISDIPSPPLHPWKDALKLDWPHAIGSDEDGDALIWQTRPFDDWKALMKELAVLKIGLRMQKPALELELNTSAGDKLLKNKKGEEIGILHGQPQSRHWLSYPVTHHEVSDWKRNNARLPNSLRFKVRPTDDGKLVGVIFHMPCLPPAAFKPDEQAIKRVWQQVHAFLDTQPTLTRTRA